MKAATTTFLALFSVACNSGPEAISYGKDACSYCKMAIVEKPFGCEIVTQKGKVAKFDAIECLVAHFKETGKDSTNSIYVTDHSIPGALIDGKTATYLQCTDIPSPMGAFLSAHSSLAKGQQADCPSGGNFFDWDQLANTEF